eukprot:11188335-Lingulodinium_polyedra.AAC.1
MTIVVVGAASPIQRRAEAGLPVMSVCPRCGEAPESALRRFWQCRANACIVDPAVVATQHMCARALRE